MPRDLNYDPQTRPALSPADIVEAGWCSGSFRRSDYDPTHACRPDKFCMFGALGRALNYRVDEDDIGDGHTPFVKMKQYLPRLGFDCFDEAYDWNDRQESSAPVAARLRSAAHGGEG